MRRQLRQHLPVLAHWFGVMPWHLDDMPYGEIETFVDACRRLPPVGGVALVEPKKGR